MMSSNGKSISSEEQCSDVTLDIRKGRAVG